MRLTETLLVTAGRVAFVGLWFFAVLLVYSGLGRTSAGLAEAGLFAVAIAVIKLASGIVADPIDLASMRDVPRLMKSDRAQAFAILRAGMALRLGAATTIVALLLIAGPPLLAGPFDRPELVALLPAVIAAIFGDTVFRAMLVMFQAQERFTAFILVEAALQTGRFTAILILWATSSIHAGTVLASYAIISCLAALAAAVASPRMLWHPLRVDRHHVLNIVLYLKWMIPAMLLAAVNERLDIFLIYTKIGATSAGLYGAVLSIALVPDILAGCLSTVLQPRIAGLAADGGFMAEWRRFLLLAGPLAAAGFGVSLLLARPVIGMLLGPAYLAAVPAFLWLLAGTLFWLVVTPLPMTLIAVMAPSRLALVTVLQAAIVVSAGLLFLHLEGLLGMAQAVALMRVAVSLGLAIMARGMVSREARVTAGQPA